MRDDRNIEQTRKTPASRVAPRVRRGACTLVSMTAGIAGAQPTSPPTAAGRQSLDDAWWTGPVAAASAATLPRGHFLIEPYFSDVMTGGSHGFGSRTYLVYGLLDRMPVGVIPTAAFTRVNGGPSSSRVRLGDVTFATQYRLTQFREGGWVPTTSVVLQETLPTGKYDRLGDRSSDASGGGAYTTTLALYSQRYFWLPNGRVLRMRLDVSQAVSRAVHVEGVSVYGTDAGFRGSAKPGTSLFVDPSWAYSVTRKVVFALEATYTRNGNTRVTGYDGPFPTGAQDPPRVRRDSGPGGAFAVVPAVEYSWTPNLGVLVGARAIAGGRNTTASMTPVVAVNFVH